MTGAVAGGDPAGLGRGPLTRWLPTFVQVSSEASEPEPFEFDVVAPRRLAARVALSERRFVVPAIVLQVVDQVGQAAVPVIVGLAMDRALDAGNASQLVLWLVVLGLTFATQALAFRVTALLTARAIHTVVHRLRSTLSRRVIHVDAPSVRPADGAVLSTATNDLDGLSLAVLAAIFPAGQVAGIAFSVVVLFGIYWPLGVSVVVGVPVLLWASGRLLGPFSRGQQQYQRLLAAAVGRATDLVAGYRVIKGIGAEREATRRYQVASREALEGAVRSTGPLARLRAGTSALNAVLMAAVAGLAGLYAVDGQISVGELIAAVGLAQALLPQLNGLTSDAGTWWATAVASAGRLLDVTAGAPAAEQSTAEAPPVSLATVPTVEISVGDQLVVRVEPGELIGVRADDRTATCIVSALLDSDPDGEVHVSLDGIPAVDLARATYRSRVVVAPHLAFLFSGTIADNVDLPGAPVDRRPAALRAAACDDFIGSTSEGVDSQVGEAGNRLSGGQRQRVALARALASDAPVLVLHDPTTAVDSVTDTTIATRLAEMRRGRSTIVVASSPALLGACDRIIDVELVEDGTVEPVVGIAADGVPV